MTAETEKELQQQKKRFRELAGKCYMQNVYCFTGFLGMAQLDCFYHAQPEFSHVPYTLFGGNDGCERQMVRFGSKEQLGYEEPFPIVCLELAPLQEKFAEELTHRDVLGACMNLGIDRSTMGDIVMHGKCAYLYCVETIAPYIMEHLTKIRHTNVSCRLFDGEMDALAPKLMQKEYQTASERLDGIVAKAYNLSREKSLLLFREKKIFVNGRQQENNSGVPKTGDVVSVRGYGRFVYRGVTHTTKKGKCNIVVEFYV